MAACLFDRNCEAQDLKRLRGTEVMEIPQEGGNLRLRFDFWNCHCTPITEDRTFEHPEPPFNRLFLFFDRGGEVVTGGRCFRLRPETFYLLPEGRPFVATYFKGGNLLYVHFHLADRTLHRAFAGQGGIYELHSPPLAALFAEQRNSPWNPELQNAVVGAVVRMLTPEMRNTLKERAGLAEEFGSLFSLLEETPVAQVRISELADAAGMTPDALSKRFRRRFGVALKEFISNRVLQQARQMLAGSNAPITDVARQLGYRDPHYFHRFFLKRGGCTPQEFRKRGKPY